jgi:hypothetical protein
VAEVDVVVTVLDEHTCTLGEVKVLCGSWCAGACSAGVVHQAGSGAVAAAGAGARGHL